LSGGGALDDWSGNGNLLTASFPNGAGWSAAGKDHEVASPAALTAYAIGLKDS
jgi:vibriolysin